MAKHDVLIGQTDYSVFVFIPDPSSTDGSGKTGVVAANLTVSGARMETDNDATVIDYTSSLNDLAALTTAHTDWGLKEVSSTLAPGLYRLDIADAIFASGAWSAVVYVMITSSAAAASPMEFVLTPYSFATGALPANAVNRASFAADTGLQSLHSGTAQAGGASSITFNAGASAVDDFYNDQSVYLTSGTGAGQFAPSITNYVGSTKVATVNITWATNPDSTTGFATFPGGGVAQTGDAYARLGAPAGASVSADIAAIEAQTDDIGAAGAGLTAVPWNATWDAEVQSEVQDALNSTIADSIPADGTLPSISQALYMIAQRLWECKVVSGVATVYKANGTTPLFTIQLNSSTSPTEATRLT